MEKLISDKVFVLHVKSGYEDRELSIRQQFERHQIDFEFFLDGDMPEINPNLLDSYFIGEMKKVTPYTSCALKHILVYEKIVKDQLKGALIFEDDILIDQNFTEIFNKTMFEIENRNDIDKELVYISYEDSTLEYVPKKDIIPGQYLYKAKKGRCAGAYYITFKVAQIILDYIKQKKCGITIDWFHNEIVENSEINIYWCHPTIAIQGSHNGRFKSSLDNKSHGLFQRFVFNGRKFFRKRK